MGMNKLKLAATALGVLCASCAQERDGEREKPIERVGPPVSSVVSEVPVEAVQEVDLSGQLREPNLLEHLEDSGDQGKGSNAVPPSVPRPVVIRGGDAAPVPEPPLSKPTVPE